jgi:hypothetical protein
MSRRNPREKNLDVAGKENSPAVEFHQTVFKIYFCEKSGNPARNGATLPQGRARNGLTARSAHPYLKIITNVLIFC